MIKKDELNLQQQKSAITQKGTYRKDGSQRPDIKIKAGYIPPDEVPTYTIPQNRIQADQNVVSHVNYSNEKQQYKDHNQIDQQKQYSSKNRLHNNIQDQNGQQEQSFYSQMEERGQIKVTKQRKHKKKPKQSLQNSTPNEIYVVKQDQQEMQPLKQQEVKQQSQNQVIDVTMNDFQLMNIKNADAKQLQNENPRVNPQIPVNNIQMQKQNASTSEKQNKQNSVQYGYQEKQLTHHHKPMHQNQQINNKMQYQYFYEYQEKESGKDEQPVIQQNHSGNSKKEKKIVEIQYIKKSPDDYYHEQDYCNNTAQYSNKQQQSKNENALQYYEQYQPKQTPSETAQTIGNNQSQVSKGGKTYYVTFQEKDNNQEINYQQKCQTNK